MQQERGGWGEENVKALILAEVIVTHDNLTNTHINIYIYIYSICFVSVKVHGDHKTVTKS